MKPAFVFNMAGGGGGSGIKLASVEILTSPAKLDYITGDTFDPSGMTVEATYSNGAKRMVTDFQCIPEIIEDDMQSVTIRYTEEGVSAQAQQPVQVSPKLTGLTISIQPNRNEYEYLDSFDPTGMVVEAAFSNGDLTFPADFQCRPEYFTQIGEQTVTVSWSKDGIEVETTLLVVVQRKTIAYPEQAEELVYNGSAQQPTWTGSDKQMTASGVLEATDAGTYEVWFTPSDLCRWEDGTTEAKKVTWSVSKAPGVIVISDAALELDGANPNKTVTVTGNEGAAIHAVSNDETVATVSVTEGELTVIGVKDGDTVITVTVEESGNYLSAEKVLPVSMRFYAETFSDNDWSTIVAACHSGFAPESWATGDSKTMLLKHDDGEEVEYQIDIIGRYHDEYQDGTKAPLTLMLHGTTPEKYAMGSSATNRGGCIKKEMFGSGGMLELWKEKLPEEARDGIRPVIKAFNEGQGATANTHEAFHLFTPSIVEVVGEDAASAESITHGGIYAMEGSQYEYFKESSNRIKRSGTNFAVAYWTRTACAVNGYSFYYINEIGETAVASPTVSKYVSFGFCF